MNNSTAQIAMIREYVNGLLDGLGLAAYLFEFESCGEQLEVKVECAVDDGWRSISILLDQESLTASCDNQPLKQQLIEQLEESLCDCKRRPA